MRNLLTQLPASLMTRRTIKEAAGCGSGIEMVTTGNSGYMVDA
jgi:hypothetical protein